MSTKLFIILIIILSIAGCGQQPMKKLPNRVDDNKTEMKTDKKPIKKPLDTVPLAPLFNIKKDKNSNFKESKRDERNKEIKKIDLSEKIK